MVIVTCSRTAEHTQVTVTEPFESKKHTTLTKVLEELRASTCRAVRASQTEMRAQWPQGAGLYRGSAGPRAIAGSPYPFNTTETTTSGL